MKNKIQRLRLALAMAGVLADDMSIEMILKVMEGIDKKGDDFNIADGAKIEMEVMGRISKKEIIAEKQ